jgi:hypothetical protein
MSPYLDGSSTRDDAPIDRDHESSSPPPSAADLQDNDTIEATTTTIDAKAMDGE